MSAKDAVDVEPSLGKRRRTEEDSSAPPKEGGVPPSGWENLEVVQYDEKLWFGDGNIVIRVQAKPTETGDAPKVMCFKCHKFVLAGRSSFFQSMFDLPQVVEGQPTHDGLPCVDFTDDFEDVRDLLLMLYGLLDIRQSDRCFDPMTAISGPLKLANKYDMPEDVERLSRIFELYWPDDYDRWVYRQECMRLEHDNAGTGDGVREPASVLVLAEQLKLTTLLRSVWYEISRSHAADLDHSAARATTMNNARRVVELDLLNDECKKRLILGRERLHNLVRHKLDTLDGFFSDESDRYSGHHSNEPGCSRAAKTLWTTAKNGYKLLDVVQDPLGEFSKLRKELKTCTKTVRHDCPHLIFASRLHQAEADIWRMLPVVFGFGIVQDWRGATLLPPGPPVGGWGVPSSPEPGTPPNHGGYW